MIPISETANRIAWIDCVRGITICLVVIFHAHLYIRYHTNIVVPQEISYMISRLGYIRMPAFFLCAGIIFSSFRNKTWSDFINRRVVFFIWIVTLWSVLFYLVENSGLKLYNTDEVTYIPARHLLIVPYGVLWFMYALLLVSVLAMLIRNMNIYRQIALVLALAIAIDTINGHINLPKGTGYELLLGGISEKALIFFMIGFLFKNNIIDAFSRKDTTRTIFLVSLLAGTSIAYLRPMDEGIWRSIFLSIPFTLVFISLVVMLTRPSHLTSALTLLGKNSLEIYLGHKLFIAAATAFLASSGLASSPATFLIMVSTASVAFPLLLKFFLNMSGLHFFFEAPASISRNLKHRPVNPHSTP